MDMTLQELKNTHRASVERGRGYFSALRNIALYLGERMDTKHGAYWTLSQRGVTILYRKHLVWLSHKEERYIEYVKVFEGEVLYFSNNILDVRENWVVMLYAPDSAAQEEIERFNDHFGTWLSMVEELLPAARERKNAKELIAEERERQELIGVLLLAKEKEEEPCAPI